MSVSQVDFFHYFNWLFKYTKIEDFQRRLINKCGVAPSLLLQQAYLSGGDTGHFMAVETSFPKGAILDRRDAS